MGKVSSGRLIKQISLNPHVFNIWKEDIVRNHLYSDNCLGNEKFTIKLWTKQTNNNIIGGEEKRRPGVQSTKYSNRNTYTIFLRNSTNNVTIV